MRGGRAGGLDRREDLTSGGWPSRIAFSTPADAGPSAVSCDAARSRAFQSSAFSSATTALIRSTACAGGRGWGWAYSFTSATGTRTAAPHPSRQSSASPRSRPLRVAPSHSVR